MVQLAMCFAVISLVGSGLAHADKVFNGGRGAAWDCKKDPVVKIDHGAGTYTFKGSCKAIHVNGAANKLTIESSEALNVTGASNTITVGAVDKIDLVGASNTIVYKSGVTRDAPAVEDVGADNRVSRDKAVGAATPKAAAAPSADGSAHDCAKQPDVTINEGDGNHRFVGSCAKILINGGDVTANIERVQSLVLNGSDNTITLGTVDKITVNGSDNKISYRASGSGGKPKVSSLGDNNKISQVK
ncbi:MAG: DUF3060 domain-containing protein [Myxococcales bacterium]|nr:DUF3060 domain-containing protein [Myxococcales bacterium]